jgi:hypothetical protein
MDPFFLSSLSDVSDGLHHPARIWTPVRVACVCATSVGLVDPARLGNTTTSFVELGQITQYELVSPDAQDRRYWRIRILFHVETNCTCHDDVACGGLMAGEDAARNLPQRQLNSGKPTVHERNSRHRQLART